MKDREAACAACAATVTVTPKGEETCEAHFKPADVEGAEEAFERANMASPATQHKSYKEKVGEHSTARWEEEGGWRARRGTSTGKRGQLCSHFAHHRCALFRVCSACRPPVRLICPQCQAVDAEVQGAAGAMEADFNSYVCGCLGCCDDQKCPYKVAYSTVAEAMADDGESD